MIISRVLGLLMALTAAVISTSSVHSQPLQPRPEVGEAIPFELPATNTIMLENGLVVTFIPWGMTPTAQILVSVRAGNIDDGMETWLADITTALMEEGAAGRSKEETAILFADMGGSLVTSVTHTHSNFATYILSENAPDAIHLLADTVLRPDFSSEALSGVQQTITHDLERNRSLPDVIATEAFLELLYPEDHPYHRAYPTDAQINGYRVSDLRRFYRNHFGAGRTHIYVAGRFDHSAMETAIRDTFGQWTIGPADTAPDGIPAQGPTVRLIDRPGALQSTVRLIYPVSAIDQKMAPALEVFDIAIGSMIAGHNRESGYSYSPFTYISWTRDGGYWTYADDINSPMTANALTDVLSVIGWQRENVWDASLTRDWMASNFVMATASTNGLLDQMISRDAHDLPFDYLDTYVPRILGVDDREVTAMAHAYLRDNRLTLVIVGDLDLIEHDIRAIPALQGANFIVTRD